MFFSISKEIKNNFSKTVQLGKLFVNTDEGWKQTTIGDWQLLYKGYSDDQSLTDIVLDVLESKYPTLLGNFCVIAYNKQTDKISIKTDLYRSFPIYVSDGEITNLTKYQDVIWCDSQISIDAHLTVEETKHDVLGQFDQSPLTADQAIELIAKRLDAKAQQFVEHNKLPIRVFLSGGVDSLLVYSFLQKYTDNYEIVNYSYFYYDRFWLKNSAEIKKNWAYSQLHHWSDACVLTSGAPGDEFMLRSPTTIDLLLKAHGTGLEQLTADYPDSLHYEYFMLDKHIKLYASLTAPATENLNQYLCNILINDFQHWHLGNTLTWTPLRDIEITKLLLRVPVEQLIPQIMNSDISRKLIDANAPGLTRVISDKKNHGSYMSNLADFYDSIFDKKPQ